MQPSSNVANRRQLQLYFLNTRSLKHICLCHKTSNTLVSSFHKSHIQFLFQLYFWICISWANTKPRVDMLEVKVITKWSSMLIEDAFPGYQVSSTTSTCPDHHKREQTAGFEATWKTSSDIRTVKHEKELLDVESSKQEATLLYTLLYTIHFK